MARMSKQAKEEKANRDYNTAMVALTGARDLLIERYEILVALKADSTIAEPLADAINAMHDRISDLEKTREFVPVAHYAGLEGFADPMHW